MIKKLGYFLLIVLSYANLNIAFTTDVLEDEIEVKFFNIGQGNCTLIKCPNGPALLVDGGSSMEPSEIGDDIDVRNYIEDIQQSIRDCLPVLESDVDINVVVSHGDKDHYNKIPDILNSFLIEKKKVKFILGGEESHYYGDNNHFSYQKDFKKLLSVHPQKVFANAVGEDHLPPLECGEVDVKILSAHGSNPNAGSIVLKGKYGNFSFILTGDAEGETTDKILMKSALNNDLNNLSVDILQMCHHGSDTEGSNNIAWIQRTNPCYAIFSAGLRGGNYRHPRYSTVERLIAFSPTLKQELPMHQFTCSGVRTFIKNCPNIKPKNLTYNGKDFNILETTYGIYNTNNSGHITFRWSGTSESLENPDLL